MKVAVVGATGLVGRKMLQVLEERNFPVTELIPVASERSVGKEITFKGKNYKVMGMQDAINMKPQLAIFSAGGDNSSAWRMDPTKKLVIPEINANTLTKEDKIIANPNCSTIQMLVTLAPLHRKYGIKRVVVSTDQAVTGSGLKGINQLEGEREGREVKKAYAHPIDRNCLPHCDSFTENGYTKEEMKLVNETCKILNDDTIKVTATAVRVPVMGGHSESVNIEFKQDYDLNALRELLAHSEGIIVQDNPAQDLYPMAITANEKDEVFVGRIRRDFSQPNSLNLWIVSDNLRKGAATNAVQIAEYLCKHQLL